MSFTCVKNGSPGLEIEGLSIDRSFVKIGLPEPSRVDIGNSDEGLWIKLGRIETTGTEG